MLEIRLDAMHHFWRQWGGSVDLDHAVLASPPNGKLRRNTIDLKSSM
jgi:hypothetical protein